MNLIVGMIRPEERLVIIENNAELQPPETIRRVVRLESQPATPDREAEITMQDLVWNAVKMRPDRIISGEVQGAEVLTMLETINAGHDGSMMLIHANSVHDAITRLETMVAYGNPTIPVLAVREMMSSALDLVILQQRLHDGSRKVVKLAKVTGMQGDVILVQDIFEFRQTGIKDDKIKGYFTATGQIPQFLSRIQAARVDLPLSIFTPQQYRDT